MAKVYGEIIVKFMKLKPKEQPKNKGLFIGKRILTVPYTECFMINLIMDY